MGKKNTTLRVHALVEHSLANGPGRRAVIWLQGCPLSCKGCFNTDLMDSQGGTHKQIAEVLAWILSLTGVEGLTISGGEPTGQLPALVTLLAKVRKKTALSILVFSGRTLDEILKSPGGRELVLLTDVLVDGPYDYTKKNPPGVWPSSANQQIHFFTSRYALADLSDLPFYETWITEQGEIMESGFGSLTGKKE